MMTESFKQFLDSLDDELLLSWLAFHYGTYEPKWEECSRKEYEKHHGAFGINDVLTQQSLEKFVSSLFKKGNYKVEPINNDFKGGLLDRLKLQDRKPDSYKFYKQVGEDFVIKLGSDLYEYCQTRDIMKPYFQLTT